MSVDLLATPYSLEETGRGFIDAVEKLHKRVSMLREQGALTEATLQSYFGHKRFEQIAESNALEGSTLNVGETELAVLRGVTITGHDPAYTQDAIFLSTALARVTELARLNVPTNLDQLRQIHDLVLGTRPGHGIFRSEPVRISGSDHNPPATWKAVMDAMEEWEIWSVENPSVPALLRGILLHTWLTHIHPFIDGNGRTARAVLNLELIRAGFPSVIIRRKDRVRYLDALAESDSGGDLGPVASLIMDRAEDALRDLERAAKTQQGYSEVAAIIRGRKERQLAIWNDSIKLLFSLVEEALEHAFDPGHVKLRWFDDALGMEDFISLSEGDSSGNSWLFRVEVNIPAIGSSSYLAWAGERGDSLQRFDSLGHGPSVRWSVPDPSGYRKWVDAGMQSPGGIELTLKLPNVDAWIVLNNGQTITRTSPSSLVEDIVSDILASLGLNSR